VGILDALLDARRGDRVEESFDTRQHPRSLHGPHGGQFVRKLGALASPGGGRTRIPEGSGPRNPTPDTQPRSPKQATSTDLRGKPRAPGTGSERPTPKPNRRKLTEAELPKAVGRGSWSRPAKKAVTDMLAGKVPDTETAHRAKNPDGSLGHYSPERIALHSQIVRALFQGAGTHREDAKAIFLAGGPASGKSTLVKGGDVHLPADAVDINPDTIKAMLPEYKALIDAGDKSASAKVHEESSHLSKLAMNLALLRKHHVIVDSVGNSEAGKFAGKIRATLDAGYETSVTYATVPTDVALARAETRAKKTGRHVPAGYLRASHRDVTIRFLDDISTMDGVAVRVFDTTTKRPKLIAEKAIKGSLAVRNRKLYELFVGKAGR
jgi:predicted ABC-type ATPase